MYRQTRSNEHFLQPSVYTQVQVLFKDAPDLLAEFKDFLPEIGMMHSGGIPIIPHPITGTSGAPTSSWNVPPDASPEKPSKKPGQQPAKRKKRVPDKDTTPVPALRAAPISKVYHTVSLFQGCISHLFFKGEESKASP